MKFNVIKIHCKACGRAFFEIEGDPVWACRNCETELHDDQCTELEKLAHMVTVNPISGATAVWVIGDARREIR